MRISVSVRPGSSKNQIEPDGQGLKVWLRAQPEDGKANHALVCVLAEHYGVAKSAVRILRGEGSRKKLIEIEGFGGPEGT